MIAEIEKFVHIPVGPLLLEGSLEIPENAKAIVAFAHGSGSSRHSPRNQYVAQVLNDGGIATLLFDLLTVAEDRVYETRFNIDLLAERLIGATKWLQTHDETKDLKIGYFGASTGAAAALIAAAELGSEIGAVVSRGGRPDLAEPVLHRVKTPTLLIVGGYDDVVIELNQKAYDLMNAPKELAIVPGATHLFEEPGTLEQAARLAKEWFARHLIKQRV